LTRLAHAKDDIMFSDFQEEDFFVAPGSSFVAPCESLPNTSPKTSYLTSQMLQERK